MRLLSRSLACSSCAATAPRPVPPKASRASALPRGLTSAAGSASANSAEAAIKSSCVRSSRTRPVRTQSPTIFPMTSCACRKGRPWAHQEVGEVRRGREIAAQGFGHALGAERRVHEQRVQHREADVGGVEGVEQCLFVFLHVFVVRERQALHHRQKADQVAVNAAGLAAHQFGHVRVLLLRHDGAAGRHVVAHLHPAELGRVPQDQLLAQPRQVHHHEGEGRDRLDGEVPVRDGV